MSMRPVSRSLFALAALVVASLSTQRCLAERPSQSLYPATIGSKWIYEAGSVELTEEITSFDIVEGERCARVETRINGRVVADEHLAMRKDGLYRVSVSGERVVPPLCFLKYPSANQARWDVSSKINDVQIAGQFALGQTKVTVPAGEFQAMTVHGTKFASESGALEFTYYFVPGIGKVKQVITMNGKSAELLLKEYIPAR